MNQIKRHVRIHSTPKVTRARVLTQYVCSHCARYWNYHNEYQRIIKTDVIPNETGQHHHPQVVGCATENGHGARHYAVRAGRQQGHHRTTVADQSVDEFITAFLLRNV